MAGDRNGELVCGAGSSHGAHGLGCANATSNLGIGYGFADWDFLESLPNPLLERRAANIQRQIRVYARRLHKADNASNQRFVVAIRPDEMRLGESILQAAHEAVGIVSQKNGRNAL